MLSSLARVAICLTAAIAAIVGHFVQPEKIDAQTQAQTAPQLVANIATPPPPVSRPRSLFVWTSCAQEAYISSSNPVGVSKELLSSGPIAVERLIWGPGLDEASTAVGYRLEIVLWMPYGITLESTSASAAKSTLAFDSYPRAIEAGYPYAQEYSVAFRSLAAKTPRLWLYYGSSDTMPDDPQRWAWSIVPAVEAKAGIIVDAMADKWTAKHWRGYQTITGAGLPIGGEPWTGKRTAWSELGVPCFVLWQTAKSVIKDNFSPGWGVEPKPAGGVCILVEDEKRITDREASDLIGKGYRLGFPLKTSPDRLRTLSAVGASK